MRTDIGCGLSSPLTGAGDGEDDGDCDGVGDADDDGDGDAAGDDDDCDGDGDGCGSLSGGELRVMVAVSCLAVERLVNFRGLRFWHSARSGVVSAQPGSCTSWSREP
ncbi:hypothetical protein E4K10_45685 [Streptomyces sp. T1317-0309]|nr:hypothetical protein E4K10_45685 [Streptomyces sp. T1317-0309]